jgi:cell division protein FtsN
MEVEVDPGEIARNRASQKTELYLLQAGSFKQRDDADRRRAELLLLGLEPKIEETNGDNGRWFRVYVGPFESRSRMARARSLTAAQDIDTLLLIRNKP